MNPVDIVNSAAAVLLAEARELEACAARMQAGGNSHDGYIEAIDLMSRALSDGGKIVVTGVGKSGKISEKIVATMLSTGTNAMFLHPVEALHGDLGAVSEKDVVLALSFSGNTEELMRIVPSLNHRGVPIIGLGGNPKSQLAKVSAAWIDGFVSREASDIPAPTSSTTLALAMGDAIALSLAQLRAFTKHGFALNHPGGSLGRRLLLRVKDAMIPADKVATVSPSASLDVVIMEMTRHPKGGCVIVVQDEEEGMDDETLLPSPPSSAASDEGGERACQILGVITHSNIHSILMSSARESMFDIRAADIMARNPVTCSVNDLASDAMQVMVKQNPTGHELPLLPVVDDKAAGQPWRGVVILKDLQELF